MQKLFIYIFSISVALIISCDFCKENPGGGSPVAENLIVFSSVSAGSEFPSLIEIDFEGKNINKLLENALIFSKPSENNKVCYLLENGNGINELYLSDISGQNEVFIDRDNNFFKINEPVISPNGEFIAFWSDDGSVFVFEIANFSLNQLNLSNSIQSNIVFSSNSNQLAFFTDEDELTLNIFDLSNLDFAVQKTNYSGFYFRNESNTENKMYWSESGTLIYVVKSQSIDKVIFGEPGLENSFEVTSEFVGANSAFINADNSHVIFATNAGEILQRNLASGVLQLISNNFSGDCEYPKYSKNSDKVFFFISDEFENIINRNLVIAELDKSTDYSVKSRYNLTKINGENSSAFWKE